MALVSLVGERVPRTPIVWPGPCSDVVDSLTWGTDTTRPTLAQRGRKVLRECRDDFDALFRTGRLLGRRAGAGQNSADLTIREVARLLLERALLLRPRNAAAWYAYAQLLTKTYLGQDQARRAVNRALVLADSSPDSTPPDILNAMALERALALQLWVDRVRWLKDARRRFAEGPEMPDSSGPPLASRELLDLQDRLLWLYRRAMRAAEVRTRAGRAYLRELALEGAWTTLEREADSLADAGAEPAFFKAMAALGAMRQGDVMRADSLFAIAIPAMPDTLRVRFDAPPSEVRTVPDFWRRARPLWLVPLNELLVEYRSRAAYAMLVYDQSHGLGMWPRSTMVDVLMRYGAPKMIADLTARPEAWDSSLSSATTGGCFEYACPGGLARLSPEDDDSLLWVLDPPGSVIVFKQRKPGPDAASPFTEQMMPGEPRTSVAGREPLTFNSRLAPHLFRLPGQAARFRGSIPDSTTVVLYGLVPAALMGIPPGDSVRVGLFLFRDTGGFPIALESRGVYDPGPALAVTYTVSIGTGSYHYSLEAFDPLRGIAGTQRDSFFAPRWQPDSLTLSDIVLALGVNSGPPGNSLTWRDLGISPSRSLSVTQGTPLWAVWEVYGLHGDSTGTALHDVEMTLSDTSGRRLPTHVLRRSDRIRGEFRGVRLRWSTAPRTAADGRALEYVALELPPNAVGTYELRITVFDGSGRRASVWRRFRVEPL